jgi:outer membrane protein OmpA-like peptidoglycan-associated protein
MKWTSLAAAFTIGAALCACVGLPSSETAKTRVSADYEATGDTSGMRAFIYGKRTVLEFPSRPLWLSIQDENGVAVPYERDGHYYRLSRKLDHFTVRANTRVLSLSSVSKQAPPVATKAPVPVDPAPLAARPKDAASPIPSPVTVSVESEPDENATTLLRLAAAQLHEVRRAIVSGAGSAAEAKVFNARLDRVEVQLLTAASAMIRVQFDTAATDFEPDHQLVRTLVPAAKAAQRITLRGRTDARVAGRDDARIALGRALAARQFLVEQGVDGSKIKVISLSSGDFLAPVRTDAGRALNRRVEIELVDRRYAALKRQAGQLQGTAP